MRKQKNLYQKIGAVFDSEIFETLLDTGSISLKRIISKGHASDTWYDQEKNEWVALLKGEAELVFEGDDAPVILYEGDTLHIPAHVRHKVTRTSADQETIWLALYY